MVAVVMPSSQDICQVNHKTKTKNSTDHPSLQIRSLSMRAGRYQCTAARSAYLVATSISTTEDLVRAKRRFLKARSVRLHF